MATPTLMVQMYTPLAAAAAVAAGIVAEMVLVALVETLL